MTTESVREEFSRWDGYPAPKRPFQDAFVDVDAVCGEVAQLRRMLTHGYCNPDPATLRNVQEQKNRVVAAAEGVVDDPSRICDLISAVFELRRITAPVETEVGNAA